MTNIIWPQVLSANNDYSGATLLRAEDNWAVYFDYVYLVYVQYRQENGVWIFEGESEENPLE